MNETLTEDIASFVQNIVSAMGAELTTSVEDTPEATRINLSGEDGGILIRREGEGLQALQHLVATAFRRQLGEDNRIIVDCNNYRRDKDAELQRMARFVADRAKNSGAPQEMGPLNPYERRIVHHAFQDDPEVMTWSPPDDARLKRITLRARR